MLWVSSMPCGLPADETIPIGALRLVERRPRQERLPDGPGASLRPPHADHLGHPLQLVDARGRRPISYFALIRNFRRHAFLLLYLFGASPAVCSSFVAGRPHELQPLGGSTLYMPHGTSLRMGRLGYQSDAQATLAVSYNCLDSYAASLHDALTQPYPAYEGDRHPQSGRRIQPARDQRCCRSKTSSTARSAPSA